MSMESAQMFMDKVATDTAFAAKSIEFKCAEALVEFARAEGFDFSVGELTKVTSSPQGEPSGGVNVDELLEWVFSNWRDDFSASTF